MRINNTYGVTTFGLDFEIACVDKSKSFLSALVVDIHFAGKQQARLAQI